MTETGSGNTKKEAEEVKGVDFEINEPEPTNAPAQDLPDQEGLAANLGELDQLDGGIAVGAREKSTGPKELTPSDKEKIIESYRSILKKLTPSERQKVEEYYRHLRDL